VRYEIVFSPEPEEDGRMKQVPIAQVATHLSSYLELAEKESVVITRDGQPVGILVGLEDSGDLWEELMMRDPHFGTKISQARQSLQEGKGISIEALRTKFVE
jgi:antitoxin (DNA-binding transcriptional repressor) of toxin-antitoxin stability system